jgi:hypothetical protein
MDAGHLGVKGLAQIDNRDKRGVADTGFYLTPQAYAALGIVASPKPAEGSLEKSEPTAQERSVQEPQSEIRRLPQEESPQEEEPQPEQEAAVKNSEPLQEWPIEGRCDAESGSVAIPTPFYRGDTAAEVQLELPRPQPTEVGGRPEPEHTTASSRSPDRDTTFSGENKGARAQAVFDHLRRSVSSAREAEEQLDPIRREASVAGWDWIRDLEEKERKRIVAEAVKVDPRVRVQRTTPNGIYLKLAKAMLGVSEGTKPTDYSNLATLWRFAEKKSLSAAMLDQFITEHHGYRRAYQEAKKGLEDPRARTEAIQVHERKLEEVAIPPGKYSPCLNSKDLNLEHMQEDGLVVVVFRKKKWDPTTGDLEPRYIWRDAPTVEVEKLTLSLAKRQWSSREPRPSNRKDKYK